MPTCDPQSLYPHVLGLAGDAFKDGHVEIAYHLLMAAMHSAEDTADVGRLREVAAICRQMLKKLDELERPHPLSSRGSERRGNPNVFETGARTAELIITGLKLEATIHREKPRG